MLVAWKYRERNTLIQRLDPRARMIFMGCVIAAFVFAQLWDIRMLAPVFVLVITLFLMARIEWRDIKRVMIFFAIFIILIIGLNALLSGRGGPMAVLQDTSPVIFHTPPLKIPFTPWVFSISITSVRLYFAITQMMRMFSMALLAIPIPYTIDPSVYGITFRRLGVPDKAAFTMDLAFRFIPTLGRDFAITMDAQRARGYELDSLRGGIFDRLRRLAPLLVPVTMTAILTGDEVIDAMDLRAFGTRPRTWLRKLQYAPRDYIYIGLGLVILLTAVILKLFGYGQFWIPDFVAHPFG